MENGTPGEIEWWNGTPGQIKWDMNWETCRTELEFYSSSSWLNTVFYIHKITSYMYINILQCGVPSVGPDHKKMTFFGCAISKQTLDKWSIYVYKIWGKIWCNKTQPKKSYKGPKLRFLLECVPDPVFYFLWKMGAILGLKAKKLRR